MSRKHAIRKICFTASSGGHMEEISQLYEIREQYDSFLFTEKEKFLESNFCDKIIYVPQMNRHEKTFFIKMIRLFFISARVLHREKPDCIISTGALVTYPICLLGKLTGRKIIYIESFARVESCSLTGKLMKPIADLYIVQWEELKEQVPNAIYGGGIF